MRSTAFLALLAALASAPAAAQPNTGAAEIRPNEGPNARAARRPLGPNAAIARTSKLLGGQVHYPSCAAVRTVRAPPLRRGEPGYGRHLDRDGDGIACE
ncbi:MAG TPA: excalibur calcium-binding domain-containing protein [Croceibacterium sp.]|nr:excalibur calcium-binding domain-containing protein [Croceibacterium sp.]